MMTKKNYDAISKAIKENTQEYSKYINRHDLIQDLIIHMKKDNGRFDEIRFKNACGGDK